MMANTTNSKVSERKTVTIERKFTADTNERKNKVAEIPKKKKNANLN